MSQMQDRYERFMNDVRSLAHKGDKVVPSKICSKHKVISQAFGVLKDLRYVKVMSNNTIGPKTIVWIPTKELCNSDYANVLKECRKIQALAKRKNVKKHTGKEVIPADKKKTKEKVKTVATPKTEVAISPEKIKTKLTRAQVTFNGTKLVVPVFKDKISLEIGDNKISVEL